MSNLEIAKKLNNSVVSVLGHHKLEGFEKAYLIANAVKELKKLLIPDYMKPIMALQGNRLGFKTDKDTKGGYPMATVQNCLIEAVLMGVQPHGNQFNIIAGNTYITKEGFGYLLSNFPGLDYEIIPGLPRINKEKTSAAIIMSVSWKIGNAKRNTRDIELPVKMNAYMGTDAVIGKATRKSRAWLYQTITGSEIGDGDVHDLDVNDYSVVEPDSKPNEEENKRIISFIESANTLEDLNNIKMDLSDNQILNFAPSLEDRENELLIKQSAQ